jgi:LmbE family N-acetylglucosaminyl deacetylase
MSEDVLTTQPDWDDITRAMVIMAHPDDPDFSCGGTVIQMARRGIEVTYMILTNGDKGNANPDVTHAQLVEMRKREQRAAAEVAGVQHVIFMGEEDGFLQPSRDLRRRVTREIRRVRPELIICPSPERYLVGNGYINHPDHRNAGLVALEAIFPATDNMMFFPELMDEGYMPYKIRQLYVTGDANPTLQIDITDDVERKIETILCHKSQFADPQAAEKRWRTRWGEEQEDGTVRHYERFRVLSWPAPKTEAKS